MKTMENSQIFDKFGNRIKEGQVLPIEFSGTVFAKVKNNVEPIVKKPKQQKRSRNSRENNLKVIDEPDCVRIVGGKVMTTTYYIAKAIGCKHKDLLKHQVYTLKNLDTSDHVVPTGSLNPKTYWLDRTGVALILSHCEHSDNVALRFYQKFDAAEKILQERKLQQAQIDVFNRLIEVGKTLNEFNKVSKDITLTVEQLQELLNLKTE